jgi:hypothetical protein
MVKKEKGANPSQSKILISIQISQKLKNLNTQKPAYSHLTGS